MYHPIPRSENEVEEAEFELDHLAASEALPAKDALGKRKAATIWLVIYFLINSVAFGLTAVPRINLNVSLVCRHVLDQSTDEHDPVVIGGYNPQCQSGEVSSQTALIASYGTVIAGVFSAVVSPLMGRLSDKVGRTKVLMLNMMGLVGSEVVLVVIAAFPNVFDYRWLFLAYSVDGLSGSFATAMSISTAYVSDCNESDKRNVHIGRIYGAMFIGICVGPLLSSIVTKLGGDDHPLLVFFICITMRSLSIVYLKVVPESLPNATQPGSWTPRSIIQAAWPSSSPSSSMWQRVSALHPGRWLDRLVPPGSENASKFRANLILLVLINIIIYGAAMGPSEVLILYPQLVFKWSNVENNIFMSVINGFRALVATIALPFLIRIFRKPSIRRPSSSSHPTLTSPPPSTSQQQQQQQPPGPDSLDLHLLRTAIICDCIGFISYSLSPNGILYTIGGALAAFGAVGLSTTEAALTKCINGGHVGELMGGLGLLQGVVRIVAPGSVNLIYSWTAKGGFPGVAFWVCAAGLGLSWAISWGVRARK